MKVISFEGFEYSGKSTQIKLLKKYFIKNNIKSRYLHMFFKSRLNQSFFEEIIKKQNPLSNISVYKPYIEDVNKFSFEDYDAFLWTGGLGNIYDDNDHNKNQLKIFDRIATLERPIWGSPNWSF